MIDQQRCGDGQPRKDTTFMLKTLAAIGGLGIVFCSLPHLADYSRGFMRTAVAATLTDSATNPLSAGIRQNIATDAALDAVRDDCETDECYAARVAAHTAEITGQVVRAVGGVAGNR